jgi:hypothetical protein
VQRVDGWGLEEALTHSRTLWRYCQECARLGKPPIDDDIDLAASIPTVPDDTIEPGVQGRGQSIIMEIRDVDGSTPSAAASTTPEAATDAVFTQPAVIGGKVSLQNLHEARARLSFLRRSRTRAPPQGFRGLMSSVSY